MAIAQPTKPTGGKKPLDAELNLVPFIDLLVCCICFLLLTAVWVQLSSVPVSAGGGARDRGGATRPAEPLAVLVGDDGYTINLGREREVIARRGAAYDEAALGARLRGLVGRRPALLAAGLAVSAEDSVPYRQLIRALDVARGEGFEAIEVTGSGRM